MKKRIFVIHEHFATHHHFDLRLQIGENLKSWAVPKEPPKAYRVKRLAIKVEDHPVSYASFHGRIPEGEYGAGVVKIWDKGWFDLIEKNENKIEVNLHGKKLKGIYLLTNFEVAGPKKWLFYKRKVQAKKVKKVRKTGEKTTKTRNRILKNKIKIKQRSKKKVKTKRRNKKINKKGSISLKIAKLFEKLST